MEAERKDQAVEAKALVGQDLVVVEVWDQEMVGCLVQVAGATAPAAWAMEVEVETALATVAAVGPVDGTWAAPAERTGTAVDCRRATLDRRAW